MRNQLLAIACFLMSVLSVGATDFATGPTATGDGSGSDWNNIADLDTLSPVRGSGNIYYVRDSDGTNYLAKTFSTAVSGTTVIIIRKATESSHGPATGWASSMGDGQAIFNQQLKFSTAYWTFDGATRNESNWFSTNSYGFKVLQVNDTQPQVKIGTQGGAGASNIILTNVCVEGPGTLPNNGVRSYQIDMESNDQVGGIVISHCLVRGGNNHYFCRTTTGCVIEYCGSENAKSNPNNHGEVINWYYNTPNSVARYNIFRNNFTSSAGTAVIAIVTSANCSIYGNVFYSNKTTDGLVGWTGTRAGYEVTGLTFHHNTVDGGGNGTQVVTLENNSTGCSAFNNLFVNYAFSVWAGITHNYNGYSGSDGFGEGSAQINIPTTIFTDFAGHDYTLTNGTTAGTNLSAPYNIDILGNTRAGDGTQDRGAYEFLIAGDIIVPLLSSVTIDNTGTNWTFLWSEVTKQGTNYSDTNIFVNTSGQGAITLTYSSGNSNASWIYTSTNIILSSETITNGLTIVVTNQWATDLAGNLFAGITNKAVVNNSTQNQVATPTFSLVNGPYYGEQTITISCATGEAEIRYTTDGSTPTGSSTLYTTPLSFNNGLTLKAIGIKAGLGNSSVGAGAYEINAWSAHIPWTTFSVPSKGGAFVWTYRVSISDTNSYFAGGMHTNAVDGIDTLAALVRFNNEGLVVQAFNGTDWAADTTFNWTSNTLYTVTTTVDLGADVYSVNINGTAIATNYALPSNQTNTTALNYVGLINTVGAAAVDTMSFQPPVKIRLDGKLALTGNITLQ